MNDGRCIACHHPAHAGHVCGVGTYFTGTCGCRMPLWSEEDQRLAEHAAAREPWTEAELSRMPSAMELRSAVEGTIYDEDADDGWHWTVEARG